jgi:hypothetical protein
LGISSRNSLRKIGSLNGKKKFVLNNLNLNKANTFYDEKYERSIL